MIRYLVPLFLLVACSSSTATSNNNNATSTDKICTPGAYVYCRCQNRDEGTKLCHDDGKGFDACLPCESDSNPEDTSYEPYTPPDTDKDSGTPATCGDKIVQDGEECDDGNKVDTDGCDSNCKLAGTDPASSRACPGMPVHVFSGEVEYAGTTIGAPLVMQMAPSCPSAGGNTPTSGASGSERIFAVTAHKTGNLVVATSDTNFNNTIYIVGGACTAGSTAYLSCANKVDGVGNETTSAPVEAGKTYSVVVDGAGISNTQGAFRLKMRIE